MLKTPKIAKDYDHKGKVLYSNLMALYENSCSSSKYIDGVL